MGSKHSRVRLPAAPLAFADVRVRSHSAPLPIVKHFLSAAGHGKCVVYRVEDRIVIEHNCKHTHRAHYDAETGYLLFTHTLPYMQDNVEMRMCTMFHRTSVQWWDAVTEHHVDGRIDFEETRRKHRLDMDRMHISELTRGAIGPRAPPAVFQGSPLHRVVEDEREHEESVVGRG